MTLLMIENDDQRIVATNYWESEYAQRGAVFLSTNAGAFRLLVPRSQEAILREARTATEVVVSRGPWPAAGKQDAIEVLFEDGTDTPFAIQFGLEQCDRLPLDSDQGRELVLTVWVCRGGKPKLALSWPAWYRRAKRLPCLQPRG